MMIVRAKAVDLNLGETSVQSYEEGKDKTLYLVRVQRARR